MEKEKFKALIAEIYKWILQTLAEYESQMQPVADVKFKRLKAYYPPSVLQQVKRVLVDRCPVPPLAVTGIEPLAEIESWDIKGIPWLNTIFIRSDLADWEPVHFHELVHIIQWDCLGTEGYLTVWAVGTTTRGYRENPLEKMAFRHQERFESQNDPYDVVREVKQEIAALPAEAFDISRLK